MFSLYFRGKIERPGESLAAERTLLVFELTKMNAEKLDEILRYLKDQCYPERLQAFRRSLKAYRLHDGKVYYHEAAKENKPATLRLVSRGEEEMERVFF